MLYRRPPWIDRGSKIPRQRENYKYLISSVKLPNTITNSRRSFYLEL